MKTLTVHELKERLDAHQELILIDVREPSEYEGANIGGLLIPTGELQERFAEIPKDKTTVVMCRSGQRSKNVIAWLEQNYAYTNLYNLEGGLLNWAKEIDPNMLID